MKTSVFRLGCLLGLTLLVSVTGCAETNNGEPVPKPLVDPASKEGSVKMAPFSDKEGYFHQESGVGFLYPKGWDNLGVEARGPMTALGLRKDSGVAEVTLYWSYPDREISPETVGDIEHSALSTMYGDKLGKPEPVVANGKRGFRIAINGGPLGDESPGRSGVVYVFAVKSGQDWWKIKLRATVNGLARLTEVEKLLDNYRW